MILKLLNMGTKWAHSTCLCTPNSPKASLGKHVFDPFLTDFWSQNSPCSRHLVTLEGPKWLAMGSKKAHFNYLGTPNGLGSCLEKHIFDPFLTHFLSQNSRFSRHFGILGGPKRATTSSERAKNTCFGIPCGPKAERALKMGQFGTTNGSKTDQNHGFPRMIPVQLWCPNG